MLTWWRQTSRDIAVLRSARGGWGAMWRALAELLRHRRVQVSTQATMPGGPKVVLCTRVRLNGDTQTDVVRGWLAQATAEQVAGAAAAHFAAVATAVRGWAAALAFARSASRLAVVLGSAGALAALWQSKRAALLGVGVAGAAGVGRWVVGLQMRGMFRAGLRR